MRLFYRPYAPDDAEACLGLFDANVPRFFDPSEREGYERFLAAPPCSYLVGTDERGTVTACGGWFVEADPSVGGLAWGLLHPSLHGRGLGRELLEVRLARLRATPGVRSLVLRTCQHTRRFFERAGFAATVHVPDGHAPGIDLVEMRMEL